MKKMKAILTIIFIVHLNIGLSAQSHLIFHSEAADSLLLWMEKGSDINGIQNFINLPAHQIMEQLLLSIEQEAPSFKEVLSEFNPHDSLSGNVYMLDKIYKRQDEIRCILKQLKGSDFSEEVYHRVMEYFPGSYKPSRNYEVFFTLTGWQWGDAMSFNYCDNNGDIKVTGDGIPAIIFNLTLVSGLYGETLDKQMAVLKNVMSHELFHAVFSDYSKNHYQCNWNEKLEDKTLYILLNEGMAHYISDKQFLKENYDRDKLIREREKAAFSALSDSLNVICNNEFSENRREQALNSGTFGKYWSKYICITGMFMAYHIEQQEGRAGLIECVQKGPVFFWEKYSSVSERNRELFPIPGDFMMKQNK